MERSEERQERKQVEVRDRRESKQESFQTVTDQFSARARRQSREEQQQRGGKPLDPRL